MTSAPDKGLSVLEEREGALRADETSGSAPRSPPTAVGDFWSASLEALPDPALVLSRDGDVVAANALCRELFGSDPSGEALLDLIGPTETPAADDGRPRHAGRAEGRHGDGVPFVVDVSFSARQADDHRIVLLRELDAPRLVDEAQRLLDLAFDTAPIGMALFSTEGVYLRVNPALCRLLGRDREDLVGRADQELTHPEDRATDGEQAWHIRRGEIDTLQVEKRFVRPDGSDVWAIANMTFLRDDHGRPLVWLGQFQDITEGKTLEQRLRHLAEEDPLTGLPNRRGFERGLRLALDMSARHEIAGAVLLVDLDGFKDINDTHGHACGDAALVAVADALRSRLRATDLLARVGGDEFAVLLRVNPGQSGHQVLSALEREVRTATLGPDRPAIALSASIGIAAFGPGSTPSQEELLEAADASMYEAKRRER